MFFRYIFYLVISLLFLTDVFGQDVAINRPIRGVSLSMVPYGNHFIMETKLLEGVPTISEKDFYSVGVNYTYFLNNYLELETSVEFSQHRYLIKTMGVTGDFENQVDTQSSLITIPMNLRFHFLNYFYIHGGLMLCMPLQRAYSVHDQTGIGGVMGIGVQLIHHSGFGLFVNPYIKRYSLHSLFSSEYKHILLEEGIRTGIIITL